MAALTSVVVLDRGNNTTCTINLHGATVVSWRVNNQEQLFVSKQAVFDGNKPIRGGIPFIFPQFGAWSFGPQHGFARIIRWNLEKSPERLPSGDVEAIFSVMDSEFTRTMWNYPFRLTYRLILREKELHFNIGVYNPSKDLTFSFNLLLHTYFKVPDVRRCQITGLHGCTFIDKTRDGTMYQEGRESVTIGEWTDRIYQNTPQEHIITNVVSGRKMRIQKYNFPDTVVWNPWVDQSKDIGDFGDDEFPNMICVESGHVSTPVVLLPGTAFEASQILQILHPRVGANRITREVPWRHIKGKPKAMLEDFPLAELNTDASEAFIRSQDEKCTYCSEFRLISSLEEAREQNTVIKRTKGVVPICEEPDKVEKLLGGDIYGMHCFEESSNEIRQTRIKNYKRGCSVAQKSKQTQRALSDFHFIEELVPGRQDELRLLVSTLKRIFNVTPQSSLTGKNSMTLNFIRTKSSNPRPSPEFIKTINQRNFRLQDSLNFTSKSTPNSSTKCSLSHKVICCDSKVYKPSLLDNCEKGILVTGEKSMMLSENEPTTGSEKNKRNVGFVSSHAIKPKPLLSDYHRVPRFRYAKHNLKDCHNFIEEWFPLRNEDSKQLLEALKIGLSEGSQKPLQGETSLLLDLVKMKTIEQTGGIKQGSHGRYTFRPKTIPKPPVVNLTPSEISLKLCSKAGKYNAFSSKFETYDKLLTKPNKNLPHREQNSQDSCYERSPFKVALSELSYNISGCGFETSQSSSTSNIIPFSKTTSLFWSHPRNIKPEDSSELSSTSSEGSYLPARSASILRCFMNKRKSILEKIKPQEFSISSQTTLVSRQFIIMSKPHMDAVTSKGLNIRK